MTLRVSYALIVGGLFLWSLFGFALTASIANAFGQSSFAMVVVARAIALGISIGLIYRGFLERRVPPNASTIVFITFWAIYLMRVWYDTTYRPEALARPNYYYWSFSLGVAFLPALALTMFAHKISIERLYPIAIAIAGIVLVLSVVTGDTIVRTVSGVTYSSGRLALESINPISLGHVATTSLILIYWRVRMIEKSTPWRLLTVAVTLIALYVLFAAGSRGPLLALIVALLFLEFVRGGNVFVLIGLTIGIFAPLITFDASQIDAFLGTNLISRIETALEMSDASSLDRVEQWNSAWRLFLDHPVFGAALEDPSWGIYPHNVILEALMATGIVGGVLLIILISRVAIQAVQLGRRNNALSIYGALFVQYVVATQLSGSIYGSGSIWAMLACIIALASSASTKWRILEERDGDDPGSKAIGQAA